jgi:hypothetical protein
MSCGNIADELACIGRDAAALCNLDCTIKRSTTSGTPDGWNNEGSGDPVVVGTTKALKQIPKPALLQVYADRIGTHTVWHMSFPLGADVREQDTLVIASEEFTAQVKVQASYDFLLNFLVIEVL